MWILNAILIGLESVDGRMVTMNMTGRPCRECSVTCIYIEEL